MSDPTGYECFAAWHPLTQAFVAGIFTWSITAVGAAAVFVTRSPSRAVLDTMAGFASGVMLAASYWSLLEPAIQLAEDLGQTRWLSPAAGFLSGGLFLWAMDQVLPHLHVGLPLDRAEGIRTGWHRALLLVLAITLHNIPEGLAVGVAFGAVTAGLPSATLASAIVLAIGIGLQNFPEGLAVSLPLRREGMSRRRSFFYGQATALVEPIAAVIGAGACLLARPLLPWALSFAAGAMVFVVVEELVPESHRGEHADLATLGALVGFVAMMVLDVALG